MKNAAVTADKVSDFTKRAVPLAAAALLGLGLLAAAAANGDAGRAPTRQVADVGWNAATPAVPAV